MLRATPEYQIIRMSDVPIAISMVVGMDCILHGVKPNLKYGSMAFYKRLGGAEAYFGLKEIE